MKKIFTPWQHAAPVHSHDVDRANESDPTSLHLPAKGRSLILTCDMGVAAAQRRVAKAETSDNT